MTKNNNLSAWDMTCSVLTALEASLDKAREEFDEARVAAGGNPFSAGVGARAALVERLEEAARPLRHELHLHAKANGQVLPERV